jgi:hypothetical protein
MTNPFEFLDIDENEAKETLSEINRVGNRDKRICICGHSMNYHSFISTRGHHTCNAQKNACKCRNPRPVLETTNARVFNRKTQGAAGLHALTQGIAGAMEVGATIEWLIEMKCDKCDTVGPVVPVPVTQQGVISSSGHTGFDKMLCRGCRTNGQ